MTNFDHIDILLPVLLVSSFSCLPNKQNDLYQQQEEEWERGFAESMTLICLADAIPPWCKPYNVKVGILDYEAYIRT